MDSKHDILRQIPGVDELLKKPKLMELLTKQPRGLVVDSIREELDSFRSRVLKSKTGFPTSQVTDLIACILKRVDEKTRPSLRPVINATGVIIHTNLGRSNLAQAAIRHMLEVSDHYSNLEFDLAEGRRGSRYSHVESLLRELTGAQSALVVNNNAAAVYLALQTHAKGKEVIVSRGQLVEIGGSFRIPEVMERSGAHLVEVGATNKTHLFDYERAVTDNTGMLLKVHTSNFQIVGFTAEVSLPELVKLGKNRNIPVMEDLGSGCFIDLSKYGLKGEPTVQQTLNAGLDLVTFSGDKLLGGPQAGLILGKTEYIDPIKKNPVNRAFRIDKLTLAALEATLMLYRSEERALREIPVLSVLTTPQGKLQARARKAKKRFEGAAGSKASVEILKGSSRVGGGALPTQALPTRLVAITPKTMSVTEFELRLRLWTPAIVSRIEHEKVLFDVRTLQDGDIAVIERAVQEIMR